MGRARVAEPGGVGRLQPGLRAENRGRTISLECRARQQPGPDPGHPRGSL